MDKFKKIWQTVLNFTGLNTIKNPWRNGIAVAIFIFVFIIIPFFALNEAKSQTIMEASTGMTFVGGKPYNSAVVKFGEEFNKKYYVGLYLQTHLTCKENTDCKRGELNKANQAVFAQRVFHYKRHKIGLGIMYVDNKSPAYSTHTPFTLSYSYQFDSWFISYWHESCGGSCDHNGGKDLFSIGYRF